MAILRKEEATNPGTAAPSGGNLDTILGPGAVFDGKLTFKGEVRIDGTFKGEIESDDVVVISKDAHVEAEVKVGSLRLHGTLRGNVYAKNSVELHPPARIYGDIQTPSLVIPKPGVVFEGTCKMENLTGGGPKLVAKEGGKSDDKKDDKKDK